MNAPREVHQFDAPRTQLEDDEVITGRSRLPRIATDSGWLAFT